jgi:hypothetical protein
MELTAIELDLDGAGVTYIGYRNVVGDDGTLRGEEKEARNDMCAR